MSQSVKGEVLALQRLNIDGLRDEWRRRFGSPPPAIRAPDLMRRMLADRIQVEALGSDTEVDHRIAALMRAHLRGAKPKAPGSTFRAGTVLRREHLGRVHEVEVLGEGFRFEGRPYASLSQIAREITGARWNGPRFFGLREAS